MKDQGDRTVYNKKSLLALFVQLAKADDKIDDNESLFIEDMREKLGISEAELNAIWENDSSYPLESPKNERHRLTIMFHLLYLMTIDGDVAKEEEDFLHEVGIKLAVNPNLTNDLIKVMKEHINNDIPDGLINSIISKYLN